MDLLSDADGLRHIVTTRRRSLIPRIITISVVGIAARGFVSWEFVLPWLACCLAACLLEIALAGRLLAQWERRPRFAVWGAASLLFLVTASVGAVAPALWLSGGRYGPAVAAIFTMGGIPSLIVGSRGSRPAFVASAAPFILYLLCLPFLGPYPLDVVVVGVLLLVLAAAILSLFVGWAALDSADRLQAATAGEREQRREEAEAATAAKSAFVAMVSHELRTPLSAILAGAIEIENGGARANAAMIIDAGRMMRTLLNDLLDLAKIEAGRMSVETIPYDLRGVVRDTVRFWRAEARNKGLRLRLAGGRQLPAWVSGDPTRLRQVLNNLFSNALKFTEQGSITLALSASRDPGGAWQVTLTVADTGQGLTEDQVQRLFGAYEQLGSSTARTHGGTGLGLNISRELTRLMGGDLSVTSRLGAGARFSVALSLEPAEPVIEADASSLEGEMTIEGLRILVVDDHPINRRAFALILEPVCQVVAVAEDGQEALEILETEVFDVVLMDVNMPRLSGPDATRRLRASAGLNRTTAVIALTAAVTPQEVDACLAAGMDAFVMKPVEPAQLYAAIDEVVSRRAVGRPNAVDDAALAKAAAGA